MSLKPPVSSKGSIVGLLVNLAIIALFIFVPKGLEPDLSFLVGALSYALLARVLRATIAKHHRAGLKFVMRQKYAEAIPHFEKSIVFFSAHPLVDKLRCLTLLSSASMLYREMGLCNVAFCYSQMGQGEKALKIYQDVLLEYPKNGLAQAGIRMLTSISQEIP